MRLLAIDPGERWVGVASLRVEDGWAHADAMVVDRVGEHLWHTIDYITKPYMGTYTLVVESYQQRNVGHQRFSGNETLRLIGALQYAAHGWDWGWGEVAPGNPDHELPELPLHPILERWKAMRAKKNVAWRHADAAWRIAQRWLLSHKPTLAAQLYKSRLAEPHRTEYGAESHKKHLVMPSIEWRLRR
jgi:hypothetical protein